MMEDGNGSKFVSWKVWAGILGSLVLLLVGVAIASVQSGIAKAHQRIEEVNERKVSWEQYRCDMGDIKGDLAYIRQKMDKQ
jgi:hypothetical protein